MKKPLTVTQHTNRHSPFTNFTNFPALLSLLSLLIAPSTQLRVPTPDGIDLLGESPLEKCIPSCDFGPKDDTKDLALVVSKVECIVKCIREEDADATGV